MNARQKSTNEHYNRAFFDRVELASVIALPRLDRGIARAIQYSRSVVTGSPGQSPDQVGGGR